MPISVFVMNPKNLRMVVIATALAIFQKPSALHAFANSGKSCDPFRFSTFVNAGPAAKFAILGGGARKNLPTMLAWLLDRAFQAACLAVTLARAILRGVTSRTYMLKRGAAMCAIGGHLRSVGKGATTARAKLKATPSVLRNVNFKPAMPARQDFVGYV